jgi:hypothetical protein
VTPGDELVWGLALGYLAFGAFAYWAGLAWSCAPKPFVEIMVVTIYLAFIWPVYFVMLVGRDQSK